MRRKIGAVFRGMRCPTIRERDDLAAVVSQSALSAVEAEGPELRDRDVIAVTESVVVRAQGNYVSADAIAADIEEKPGGETIGVMFPILSCNRFATCLKGITKGAKRVALVLSCPSNEVGNGLVFTDKLNEAGANPYSDVLSLGIYRKLFGENRREFTGIDYVSYYGDLIRSRGAEMEIILASHSKEILKYTKNVLTCDVHTRARIKRILKADDVKRVCGLDGTMTASVNGSGYNEASSLLGSNKSTEDIVKLFPRNYQPLIQSVQKQILQAYGKHVEVTVYGDDTFKDPVGKVWELADPCASPTYTPGLEGTPSELKLRYLADNDFAQLKGGELQKAIEAKIREKEDNLVRNAASQGTIPRRLTDLIDSLCDLTSGSGDKGTPIVPIQGYFDNFTN